METTVLLAALGIVSACVGILGWVIKFLFTKILPVLENVVVATKSSDTYLRERNGRDIHFHENIMKSLLVIQEGATKQTVVEQTVENQIVNHQT